MPVQPAASPRSPIVEELHDLRIQWRERHRGRLAERFPSRGRVAGLVDHLGAALYPQRLGGFRGDAGYENAFVRDRLGLALAALKAEVGNEIAYWQAEAAQRFDEGQADRTIHHFAATLPKVRALVDADVEAAFLGDPSARSEDEVLICYPGARAVLLHRLAHQLYNLGAPIVARIISEIAHAQTGIDIHPGAIIGPSIFIDHGTGVVIGETAAIGARVKLHQQVTLGALGLLGADRDSALSAAHRYARHPVVEDDVVIHAGATLLGRITIGRGSIIGGNVWLLDDVPADSVISQPEASVQARGTARVLRDALAGRN